MRKQGFFVAEVAWPELQAQLAGGMTAILPVGAECKEHGPHLPLNTDYLQAQWLGAALVRQANVAVWPVLGYGYYPAFVDYPGSCSLSYATFSAAVREILDSILNAGARRICILNTGLSTIRPLQQALKNTTGSTKLALLNIYEGRKYQEVVAEVQSQQRGGHADELETSIMLAIDPLRVDMDKAVASVEQPIEGAFNRSNPHQPNYSPSGVYGDPTLANVNKGQRLLQAIVADLIDAL